MGVDPSAEIHASAIVEAGAEIGAGARVGPFSVVGPEVRLGAGVVLRSHAVITGQTGIGDETVVFPFANIGDVPQDLKYRGERTRLEVGARNRIREGVTMNTGTDGGGGLTRVGNDCLFMTGAHVGHDCTVGDRVVMANQVALGGHCRIGDDVVIGGLSGVHQHVRVGRGAIVGAVTMVGNDVIPYGFVQPPKGVLAGLNLIGLRRREVPRDDIAALRDAYRTLAEGEGALQDRAHRLAAETDNPYVRDVAEFILAESDRAFLVPH